MKKLSSYVLKIQSQATEEYIRGYFDGYVESLREVKKREAKILQSRKKVVEEIRPQASTGGRSRKRK